jgi:hypothetical protein
MRLRFTIRELLWLTLIVAVAIGWYADHNRLTAWNGARGIGLQIKPVRGMRPDVSVPGGHMEIERYDFAARGVASVDLKVFAVREGKILDLGTDRINETDAYSSELLGTIYMASLLPTGGDGGSGRLVGCGITADGACRPISLAGLAMDVSYRFAGSTEYKEPLFVERGEEKVIWAYYWQPRSVAQARTLNEMLASTLSLDKDKIIQFAKNTENSIVVFVTVTAK